ncbi:MAG TPA: hypothetical protein VJL86_00990 [Steroidobacteraceae bacterium]|nr:hypothetical protein [Steroidobacteraceae bacterium]
MFAKAFNDVVDLAIANTPGELVEALSPLPHGVKYGVACDLDDEGRAHRYDRARERAYYLRRHDQGVVVWRWNYITSYAEAGRLLAMVLSLNIPLNGRVASRMFTQATRRRVERPAPHVDTPRRGCGSS